MRYHFDPAKRSVNLKKHGYDLTDARLVIESSRTVTFEDNRFNCEEARYVTMGLFSDIVVVIVTAETD